MKYEEFRGKIVFLTGVAGGIGWKIAEDFVQSGATVIGVDIDTGRVEHVARELSSQGIGQCVLKTMDVTKSESVQTVVEEVETEFGCVDFLINCAGVSSMIYIKDLEETEWDRVMDVNAKGVFLSSKFIARQMLKHKKQGKIVSIASLAGKLGAMWQAHYNASKFAVVGFTQGFALELAPYKININCVCPAFVKTEMQDREVKWEAALRNWDPQQVRDNYIKMTPLGRLETPEDVSKLVLFLASSGADFITGQAYNVTGGVYMG